MGRRHGRRTAAVATFVALALVAPGAALSARAVAGRRAPSRRRLATLEVETPAVQVKPAGTAAFVDAEDGRALRPGDTVRTSTTGRAQIDYADGSLTRLDVGTEYRLVRLSDDRGDRKTKGVQTAGQTWHRVETLARDDSYRVEGANATAAVLGTAFVVTCTTPDECTFTAVVDDILLTDPTPANGTRTVTLTPGDQATMSDDAIGPVTTLTQDQLLANPWVTTNLLADQQDAKSPGLAEIGAQPDAPPTTTTTTTATPPTIGPPPPGAGTSTGAGTDSDGPPDTPPATTPTTVPPAPTTTTTTTTATTTTTTTTTTSPPVPTTHPPPPPTTTTTPPETSPPTTSPTTPTTTTPPPTTSPPEVSEVALAARPHRAPARRHHRARARARRSAAR